MYEAGVRGTEVCTLYEEGVRTSEKQVGQFSTGNQKVSAAADDLFLKNNWVSFQNRSLAGNYGGR